MSIPLKVRRIRAFKHESGEFTALSLYFPGKINIFVPSDYSSKPDAVSTYCQPPDLKDAC